MATTTPDKKTWLIIFAAMTGAVLLYGLFCFYVTQGRLANPLSAPKPPVGVLRWILTALAAASLLAAVNGMYKTNGKIGDCLKHGVSKAELMTPEEFQEHSIKALVNTETCAAIGLLVFLMGAPIKDFVPFAIGTLLVNLFYILPRGLKYWSSWEQEQKAKGQQANSSFSQSL